MRVPPPTLDPRELDDLLAELRERAPHYVPEWAAAADDPGVALMHVAAYFAELLVMRFNAVPERNLAAFLSLLGVEAIPARPARVPVSFHATPGLPARNVPRGTRVRAGNITFETTTDVRLATRPKGRPSLERIVGVVPGRDRIHRPPPRFIEQRSTPADDGISITTRAFAGAGTRQLQLSVSDVLEGGDHVEIGGEQYRVEVPDGNRVVLASPLRGDVPAGRPLLRVPELRPFDGIDDQAHELLIGDNDLLALDQGDAITVSVTVASENSTAPELALAWEYFGEDADDQPGWHELELVSDGTRALRQSGIVRLRKPAGSIEPTTVDGRTSRFIRARLTAPLAPSLRDALPVVTQIEIKGGTSTALAPDAGLYNATELDLEAGTFYPLGLQPQRLDSFYVASEEAFSKVGAQIQLCFEVLPSLGEPAVMMWGQPGDDEPYAEAFFWAATGKLSRLVIPPEGTPRWSSYEPSEELSSLSASTLLTLPVMAAPIHGGDTPGSVFVTALRRTVHRLVVKGNSKQWTTLDGPTPEDPGSAPALQLIAVLPHSANGNVTTFVIDGTSLARHEGDPFVSGDSLTKIATELSLHPSAGAAAGGHADAFSVFAVDDAGQLRHVYSKKTIKLSTIINAPVTERTKVVAADRAVDRRRRHFVVVVLLVGPSTLRVGTGPLTATTFKWSTVRFRPLSDDRSRFALQLQAKRGTVRLLTTFYDNSLRSVELDVATEVIIEANAWTKERSDVASFPAVASRRTRGVPRVDLDRIAVMREGTGNIIVRSETVARSSATANVIRSDGKNHLLTEAAVVETIELSSDNVSVGQWDVIDRHQSYYLVSTPVPPKLSTADSAWSYETKLQDTYDLDVVDVMGALQTELDETNGPVVPLASGAPLGELLFRIGGGGSLRVTEILDPQPGVAPRIVTLDPPLATEGEYPNITIHEVGFVGFPFLQLLDPPPDLPSDSRPTVWMPPNPPHTQTTERVDFVPSDPNPDHILVEAPIGATLLVPDLWTPPIWSTIDSPSANPTPELSWEYFNGRAWVRIPGLTDDTKHLGRSGDVEFPLPPDLAPVDVAGTETLWVRARLVGGTFGGQKVEIKEIIGVEVTTTTVTPVADDFEPPAVSKLSICYTLAETAVPELVIANNNLDAVDQSDANRDAEISFSPFVALEDDRDALYLGFVEPLDGGPYGIYFDTQALPFAEGSGPGLEWHLLTPTDPLPLQVEDETRGLLGEPSLVRINVPRRSVPVSRFGSSLHWIRARRTNASEASMPRIRGIYVNSAMAMQVETIRDEIVGSSTGEASQTFRLARRPVLAGNDALVLRVRETLSEQERRELASEIVFRPGDEAPWVRWREVSSLALHGPRDRVFELDPAEGEIRFGDGRYGAVPPPDTDNIRMFEYRWGGGSHGNVDAEAIDSLDSAQAGIDEVVNPVPAGGGADAAPDARIFDTASRAIAHRDRAVSARDFESLALEANPKVARALALRGTDGRLEPRPGAVAVIVIPEEDTAMPRPTQQLRQAVRTYLRERALPDLVARDAISVVEPRYVPVDVTATVAVTSHDVIGSVRDDAEARLAAWLHPLRGGDHGLGRGLGEGVRESDVVTLLSRVPGLDHVVAVELSVGAGVSAPPSPAGEIAVRSFELVAAGELEIQTVVIEAEEG